MIQTIDSIITTGSLSINKMLDQNRNRQRDLDIEHAESKVYQTIKAQANDPIEIDYIDDEDSNLQFITNQYDGDLPDFDL